MIGNVVSVLTAQKAFLNNFENIVNCKVDFREDIKRYQDTLSYASSEIDYSMGESIYMLPSDMNLNIKSETLGYNNKILVSDSGFSLGKKMIRLILQHQKSQAIRHLSCLPIKHPLFMPTKKSPQNTPQPSRIKRKKPL